MNQQTKKCPYCGEEILTVAKKCKHCGEWLAEENDRQIQPYASNHHRQTEWLEEDNDRQIQQQMKLLENADNNNNRGCGCGTILIVVLLIAAYLTNPKEEKFHTAIVEDVIKNIADKTSSGLSNISENSFVGEIGSWIVKESRENLKKKFYEQNEVKINNYWLFSTAELINSDNVGGTIVAWGAFGVVIPFVGWDDFKILNMNSKKESNTRYKHIEETTNIPERNNVSSYQEKKLSLIGDADGFPLKLTLSIVNGNVTGTYKNINYGTTMIVSGTMIDNVIYLEGKADQSNYTFQIIAKGGEYTGTFGKVGGRTMKLHLRNTQADKASAFNH